MWFNFLLNKENHWNITSCTYFLSTVKRILSKVWLKARNPRAKPDSFMWIILVKQTVHVSADKFQLWYCKLLASNAHDCICVFRWDCYTVPTSYKMWLPFSGSAVIPTVNFQHCFSSHIRNLDLKCSFRLYWT